MRDIAAYRRLAHAHIDGIRIRVRQTYGADRARAEHRPVADRLPVNSSIGGLPHPSARPAEVVNHWLRKYTCDRGRPSTAKRADGTPLQGLEGVALCG